MKFIKSKLDPVAYNVRYISYIRTIVDKEHTYMRRYAIEIGYCPGSDYKAITLANDLSIDDANDLLDEYLEKIEENEINDSLTEMAENMGWR